MTPRVLPAARRPKEPSFNLYRPPPVASTPPEERAFWKWVTTPALGTDAGELAERLGAQWIDSAFSHNTAICTLFRLGMCR